MQDNTDANLPANRRTLLAGAGSLGVLASLAAFSLWGSQSVRAKTFSVSYPDTEWRKRLTAMQYAVLRGHSTERAGSSPLDREKRTGTFHCAGCELALFLSDTKYESGTGWPSFWKPLAGAIGTSQDNTFFSVRTEVHCSRCGGHLGHVFDDGPPPTGMRYCMNGVAMTFKPASA
jgi:peptide-methionine (R)-S-oxide reductase